MKEILSHIGVAAVAIVATLLLVRGCSEPKVIRQTETIVECQTDTINVSDTVQIERVIIKRLRDTVERIVYIDTTVTSQDMMTYEEHYQDSSYSVYGNIFYKGQIERHDQMFVQNKETIEFIPRTRIIYRTRDNLIIKNSDRPKAYIGLYSTFDTYVPQQAGISLSYSDNKHRMYTVGKDLRTLEQWSVDVKIPVLWSKK